MKKTILLFTLPAMALSLLIPTASAQSVEVSDTILDNGQELVIRKIGSSTSESSASTQITESPENRNLDIKSVLKGDNSSYSSTQPPKRWKWRGGHWAGVGIYYNGLVKNLGSLSLPDGAEYMRQTPQSIGVNVNFADLTIVSNRHFGLITGLGMEINNFRFENNIGLTQNSDGQIVADYSYDEAGITLKKSKLTTVYLNVPLLAEFQFGRSKRSGKCPGFINFGIVGGVRLQSHTKVQYRDSDGKMQTDKQHSGLNLRNFHYGAEINVGYKHIALSARYYPQSIFMADKGPDLQQVNIGLSILF